MDVPPWTIFGPMVASQKLLRTDCEYAVNLSTHDSLWTSETSRVLDLESDDLCNWMKFVRFAHSAEDQNMVSSMQNGQIFFTSTKCIDAGRELKVWYSKKYSNSLGRPEHPGTFFAQKGKRSICLRTATLWQSFHPETRLYVANVGNHEILLQIVIELRRSRIEEHLRRGKETVRRSV